MRISRPTYPRAGRLPAALAALAIAVAGCGGDDPPAAPPTGRVTVYTSLPQYGVSARAGDAATTGAWLALEDAHRRAGGREVRLVRLDSTTTTGLGATWDPAKVEANARRAADDPSAVAYIGELDLGGSAVSVPVTSDAGLLQVAPADGLTALTRPDPVDPEEVPDRYYTDGRRNFLRLVPTDGQQAAVLIRLAREYGARRVAIVHDNRLFGRELAAEAAVAAQRAGVTTSDVRAARAGDDFRELAREIAEGRPQAVLYTGLGDATGRRTLAALARALPGTPRLGSSALAPSPAVPQPAVTDLVEPVPPPATRGRAARRVHQRIEGIAGDPLPPESLQGYAAMRLVLDALDTSAGRRDVRGAVLTAALRPRTVSTVLGRVRIGPGGDVTPTRFAHYRRSGGRLRFAGLLPAPPAP